MAVRVVTVDTRSTIVIDDKAIFQALHGGRGLARRETAEIARQAIIQATADAPVGNPLDRLHDGQPVGRYKAAFRVRGGATGPFSSQSEAWNTSDHASVVESGRKDTFTPRKNQVFTWSKARKNLSSSNRNPYRRGGSTPTFAFKKISNPGGLVKTPFTSGREGRRILQTAMNTVCVRRGFTPFV